MITNEESWVRNYLVPEILHNGKLIEDYKTSTIEDKQDNNNKNFILRDISIEFLSLEESFMLTKCYKVKINYEYNGKEYSNALIVKKTPSIPEETYKQVNFDALFYNEILGYKEIIPLLNTSKNYPKYYYSHRKDIEAVLVLSDFSIDGWKMSKAKVNLSLEHIILAVKELGRFHGAGYALKKTNPKKLQQIISLLKESRFDREIDGEWYLICTNGSKRSIKAAKKFKQNPIDDDIPEEFLIKLQQLIGDVTVYCKEAVKPNEPMATICHGDYLRNNIAFKYVDDNPDNLPTDVMMFDYQTLRYSSPMVDLCLILSLSTGKDVRSKHFDQILNAYRDELIRIFSERTGTDLENLPSFMSYESLLKEYIQYLPYGLSIASIFLATLFQPGDLPVEDMLAGVVTRTEEEILKTIFETGGEAVDIELSALVHELYKFSVAYNVDIFKGFTLTNNNC